MKKQLLSDYAVFEDKKLIIEVFKGVTLPGSIAEIKAIQSKDEKFSYRFDLISDYREVLFDTIISNVNKFYSYLQKYGIHFTDTHRTAILISDLNQKVYIDYFIKLKDNSENIRCFYSVGDALVWLGRIDEKCFVEEQVASLKKSLRIKKCLPVDY